MSRILSVITSMATRRMIEELASDYSRASGCRVVAEAVGGIHASNRVRAGEPFDIAVLARDAVLALEVDGHILAASVTDLANSPTAIAVRSGAPRPVRIDAQAIRNFIAGGRVIGISSGPSGSNVRTLLRDWGEGDEWEARIIQTAPGVPVASIVATGAAEVGFQQLSELIGEPGIDIVGTLPETLLPATPFAFGLCRAATNVSDAKLFAAFLASSIAGATIRKFGMKPVDCIRETEGIT